MDILETRVPYPVQSQGRPVSSIYEREQPHHSKKSQCSRVFSSGIEAHRACLLWGQKKQDSPVWGPSTGEGCQERARFTSSNDRNPKQKETTEV